LGITAIELAEGNVPYHHCKSVAEMTSLITQSQPPKLGSIINGSNWSNSFQDFVSKCVSKNPKNRPTSNQLIDHPFIRGIKQKNLNLFDDDLETYRQTKTLPVRKAKDSQQQQQQQQQNKFPETVEVSTTHDRSLPKANPLFDPTSLGTSHSSSSSSSFQTSTTPISSSHAAAKEVVAREQQEERTKEKSKDSFEETPLKNVQSTKAQCGGCSVL